MENKQMITFLDPLCRHIFAEIVEETDVKLVVKNPAVVNYIPQRDPQTGQPSGMALNLIPVFFKEFLADKNSGIVFTYNKNNITTIQTPIFDFKIKAQYEQLFTNVPNQPVIQPTSQTNSPKEVVKLFD
jgi:hypothetical protein